MIVFPGGGTGVFLRKIKVSLVGGGSSSAVGRAHITALSMDNEWDIVSILPSSEDIHSNIPQNLNGDVIIFENLDELLNSEDSKNLDFIINLTPSTIHFNQAKKILESGFNLIIEKPLSLNAEEALEIKNLASKNKLKLFIIQNYSSFVMVMALKKILEESTIGELLHIHARMLQQGFIRKLNGEFAMIQDWRLLDPEIPMVMHDLGSHLLHLVGFLSGSYPNKVIANFNLSHVHNDLIGSCEILGVNKKKTSYNLSLGKSFLGHQNNFHIELYGTLGSLKWDIANSEILVYTNEEGMKVVLDRQWAESKYPELVIFSRFKPGHTSGFVEALANYYTILKSDFDKSSRLDQVLTRPEEVLGYINVMKACLKSVASESWCDV